MIAAVRIRASNLRASGASGDAPCFLCGRETDGSRSVHLAVAGEIVPLVEDLDASDDQGWFPIGPECAKKLPAGFVRSAT